MRKQLILLILLLSFSSIFSKGNLNISEGQAGETVISVDAQLHQDYGLAFPITYEFAIPAGSADLQAERKFTTSQSWTIMPEMTANDFFNGIEAVRFDYANERAYLSVGFSDVSDSIYLKITNSAGDDISATYLGKTKYYDNRDAAVTSTADDWADWSNAKFLRTVRIWRSYNLWLSVAVVTGATTQGTWLDIQNQLDSGYVEIVSHSRTHPHVPYSSVWLEVAGSKANLIYNLDLPAHNRYGDEEYIYAWIAPYGEYDAEIEAMVAEHDYLVTRLYYDEQHNFSDWNPELNMFNTVGVSREVGPLWVGTSDSTVLNETFDTVVAAGGVYHVMCHPNVIEWDEDYTWSHLEHISNHKNIWYVGFGHMFLYHLLQDDIMPSSIADNESAQPEGFELAQNYPNPFNPSTTISYTIPRNAHVSISVTNMLGQQVASLVNQQMPSGTHQTRFDAVALPSGLYVYTLKAGNYQQSRKMVLMR